MGRQKIDPKSGMRLIQRNVDLILKEYSFHLTLESGSSGILSRVGCLI